MNTNSQPRERSEKAKEGRRRRQRERRRRQREERRQHYKWTNDDWDYDDNDGHYYDIYEDLCERNIFIVCDDKFRGCYKDFKKLSIEMAKILTAQNSSSVPNNLKTYRYVLLDEFIAKTPPSDKLNQFKISCRDLYNGKKLYNQMKNGPEPNYEIFGSNGMGYTCFGLFKSNDKNMYVIVIDGHNDNTPTHYVKIENESIFGE
jgi:hypothetical protein